MSEVTDEMVSKVASLAKLKLTSEEIKWYRGQLSEVLDYFDQLSMVDDKLGDDWRSDVSGPATPERDDIVEKKQDLDSLLKNSPKLSGTLFQVPKIIDT